jgi:hypothetical protein
VVQSERVIYESSFPLETSSKQWHLGSSWHDGFASKQFGNNAACAPHIHTDTVLRGTEQKLRRSVPQRHNATGQRLRAAAGAAVGYREAEIRDLQYPVAVDQEVRALDVSVKNPAFMAVVEAMKKLLDEALYLHARRWLLTISSSTPWANFLNDGRSQE